MNIKQVIFILSSVFFAISAQAQDEIWLLNGQKKEVSSLEFSEDNLLIRYQNEKGKIKLLSTKELFSATPEGDREYIFYKPTDEMSIENMKEYMAGEVDASNNYKAKDEFFSALGFGIVSPFMFQGYSVLTSFAYSLTLGQTKPVSSSLDFKNNSSYYQNGYNRVVRKKRLINSLIGGGVGLLVGFTSVYLVQ